MVSKELLSFYGQAVEYIHSHGYSGEVEHFESFNGELITESEFLREYAWVVLCSGFRERVVRERFPLVSLSFLDWIDAEEVASEVDDCMECALIMFPNRRKIEAIGETCVLVATEGFSHFLERVRLCPYVVLQSLPLIGPVTGQHLLKNLGFQIAKDDRHLVRAANAFGYGSAADLCEAIGVETDDSVAVVDTILWRYMSERSKERSRQ